MRKRKVLYIAHNHPSVRPGGAETYALELYEAMKEQDTFEPILLVKGGPPLSPHGQTHSGTFFGPVNSDPNQYFFYTDGYEYDWVFGTIQGKDFYTKHFRQFLTAWQPDVVHFQHTMFLGYDLIREVRTTLPRAAILYTLHEFMPICHRQGQMVRTVNEEERCLEDSPRRCHECFPAVAPATFFMRKRFVQSQFQLVDQFLAPSHFLRQRYIDWGLPAEKIAFEEYGRRDLPVLAREEPVERPRNRFGYFGQFTPFKGVKVLLEAMKELAREDGTGRRPAASPSRPHAWLNGANLDMQPGTFQNEIRALLEETRDDVTLAGRYSQDQLGNLMANLDWVIIPSIWWENSPLVIQEAFLHGRPVLCSDIGGMAEKVANGVNGLHFRAGDPIDLARAMRRAATTPGLWDTLRAGVPGIYAMTESVEKLGRLYDTLIEQKQQAS